MVGSSISEWIESVLAVIPEGYELDLTEEERDDFESAQHAFLKDTSGMALLPIKPIVVRESMPEIQEPVYYIKVKLPPQRDKNPTQHLLAIKDAIFTVKPHGFEVKWGHGLEEHVVGWPIDKEGYTYVPLYVTETGKQDTLVTYMKETQRLQELLKKVRALCAESHA